MLEGTVQVSVYNVCKLQ